MYIPNLENVKKNINDDDETKKIRRKLFVLLCIVKNVPLIKSFDNHEAIKIYEHVQSLDKKEVKIQYNKLRKKGNKHYFYNFITIFIILITGVIASQCDGINFVIALVVQFIIGCIVIKILLKTKEYDNV